ncbi:MAG TPA: DUF2007 domain-containing protein [Patescibacteria group bacterium]|nr:DUF2007 domain-containing protein [Patescibacteria group bacterium]
MPYCPACRLEYEKGFDACTDCGSTLVAGTMPEAAGEKASSEERWTALMRVRNQENAEIVRGLLQSQGFDCEVIDKRLSEMPMPVEAIAYLEIWVPESQAPEARALLNEAREGTVACKACGHMSAADEPVCEYCGALS